MRFMSMVKAAERTASVPPKALMDAIDELVQEAGKAGCDFLRRQGRNGEKEAVVTVFVDLLLGERLHRFPP